MWRRAFEPICVVAAAVLLVGAALAAPSSASARAQLDQAGEKADALGVLLNRARVSEGLKPLARNAALDRAAQEHSRDMAEHDYLEHLAPDGTASIDRAIRAGYGARKGTGWLVTEVISAISGDPQGPLDWWLKESPEVHGKVLRDPRWREVGIGYAAGGRYGNYWTVLVGCQPGVLPAVSLDGKTYEHAEECDQSPVPPPVPSPVPSRVPQPVLRVMPAASAAGGDEIEVRWEGLSDPRPADWVGLFSPSAPDGRYVAWVYLGCASTPAAAPAATGACLVAVPAGLVAGDYEARLFRAGATAAFLRSERVALQPPPAVALSATSAVVHPGDRLGVSWSGLPSPSARDWLGLYPAAGVGRPAAVWSYVSCSTAAVEARPQGTCELLVPPDAEPGAYELRFFRNESFAPSGATTVVVLPPGPPPVGVA